MRYDPNVPPLPGKWLDLDEDERMQLIEQFHRRARVELPEIRAHAAIVLVEAQPSFKNP